MPTLTTRSRAPMVMSMALGPLAALNQVQAGRPLPSGKLPAQVRRVEAPSAFDEAKFDRF